MFLFYYAWGTERPTVGVSCCWSYHFFFYARNFEGSSRFFPLVVEMIRWWVSWSSWLLMPCRSLYSRRDGILLHGSLATPTSSLTGTFSVAAAAALLLPPLLRETRDLFLMDAAVISKRGCTVHFHSYSLCNTIPIHSSTHPHTHIIIHSRAQHCGTNVRIILDSFAFDFTLHYVR